MELRADEPRPERCWSVPPPEILERDGERDRPDGPSSAVAAAVHPVFSDLSIMLAGGVMLLMLPSPMSRMQALFGPAHVVPGVPVCHLWRKVEGYRPPPSPLPSH